MGIDKTSCFIELKNRYGSDVVTDSHILAIVEDIFENRKAMEQAQDIVAQRDWDKETLLRVKIKFEDWKLKQALNLEKSREVNDFLDKFPKAKAGMRELLRVTDIKRASLDQKYKGVFIHGLKYNNAVKGVDLWDAAHSGVFDKEVMIASEHMERTGRIPTDLNLPQEAIEIAKVYRALYDEIHMDMRRAGIQVGHIENYMGRQIHDGGRILDSTADDLGFGVWSQEMMNRLDVVKSFGKKAGSRSEMMAQLKSDFDDIIHGWNETAEVPKGVEDKLIDVVKNSSMVEANSRSRKYHFKTAEDAYEYNQKFGRRNIIDQAIVAMDVNARVTSLADTFGSNPKATFFKKAKERNILTSDNEIDIFTNAMYKNLSGEALRGGNSTMAAFGRGVRAWQNLSKLPMAGISAFSDLGALASMQAKYSGEGSGKFMSSLTSAPLEVFARMNKPEQIKYSQMFGLFYDDLLDALHARYDITGERIGPNHEITNFMLKMEAALFRYNGLNAITHRTKIAGARLLSAFYGAEKGLKFSDLPEHLSSKLTRHKITPEMWDQLRGSITNMDGVDYIDPSTLAKLAPDTSERFRMMLIDTIEKEASPTPGLKEQAFQNMGFPQDTVHGQLWRIATQYTSFPLSMVSTVQRAAGFVPEKGFKENIRGMDKTQLSQMSSLMFGLTAYGYLAMSMKDIAKGKTPRTFENREQFMSIFMNSFIQGGGATIYGDFIAQDPGLGSAVARMLGPTASSVDDITKMFWKLGKRATDEKPDEASAFVTDLLNTGLRQSVGNWPIVKPLIEQSFMTPLREDRNPGHTKRMLKRMKEKGHTMLLPQPLGR